MPSASAPASPLEAITAPTISETNATPAHWTPVSRVGFRIAFLYFFCFLFLYGNGTILGVIPRIGDWIEDKFSWPAIHFAPWIGVHLFHLSGIAATWHATGSGDTALSWVMNGLFLFFAIAGGLLWTLIATLRGTRRTEYQTMYAWLRFLLRLTIGMQMLSYGMAKVFPTQMPPISIAILNEPIGQSSPMTLLWSLIGLNPVYEMICGWAEVFAGTLILFRRTALFGSLLTAFVTVNIVLYNFFFDVPVKLFAANLLLAALFVILPDVPALFSFFWLHKPAAPTGVWVPSAKRRSFRIATRVIELAFMAAFLILIPYEANKNWHEVTAARRTASPLIGAWHIESGQSATGAFITSEGLPSSDFYVDDIRRASRRAADGTLWRTGLAIDPAAKRITINPRLAEPVTYSWQMPDNNHLILTSIAPEAPKPDPNTEGNTTAFTPEVVTLTRTALPAHYPLLERGFHLVNEFGHQR